MISGSKSRQAFAASNLYELGLAPDACSAKAREWGTRVKMRTGDTIALTTCGYPLAIQGETAGRLFLSVHYSDYAVIYKALAVASGRPVYALIGAQHSEHAAALAALAASEGVDLRFIESGLSMVRKARKALSEGSPVLLLIDIPWTQSGAETDMEYSCGPGVMQANSSLARLISLIDGAPRLLLAGPQASPGLKSFDCTLEQAYALFGQALAEEPVDYERLDKLHRYFRPHTNRRAAVCFSIGSDDFAVHARSGGSWRIKSGLVTELKHGDETAHYSLRTALSRLAGQEIDVVLSV